MNRLYFRLSTFAFCLLCAPALAQPYPAKPVRMVMPFPAGGPTDILGRLIGQRLTETWGQNVMIDNRPGGAGMIGAVAAVKSFDSSALLTFSR